MSKSTNGVPTDRHALLDATVLAGTTTGAVAGAMAGPPGVIVGGTIGAAIGVLAGAVLDREMHQADRHDRELDDAIGVTAGDLGERDAIRAGTTGTAAALLRGEHARLEVIYDRLLEAYRFGDWNDVCAQWAIFEPALRAHMTLEEEQVFPAFREIDALEAEQLLAEHDALRAQLGVLGVNIELHAVTPVDADDLIAQVRRHRAREEKLLYPWMDKTFSRPIGRSEEP